MGEVVEVLDAMEEEVLKKITVCSFFFTRIVAWNVLASAFLPRKPVAVPGRLGVDFDSVAAA